MHAATWFEIPVSDLTRATSFYETVLGQPLKQVEFMGGLQAFFPNEGETAVGGALVPGEHYQPVNGGAVVYLNAGRDLDAMLNRVSLAGGKIVLPKTDISPNGFFAWIQDSEGNRVGLHQPG